MSNDIAVVLKAVTNIIFVASSFLFRNKIKELRFAKDELDQTYQRFALLRFMHLSFLIFEYEVVLLKVKMTINIQNYDNKIQNYDGKMFKGQLPTMVTFS